MNYLTTDTDLTAVADAIREKGGTSASLSFPDGFVNAIMTISGGGYSIDDILNATVPSGVARFTTTKDIAGYQIAQKNLMTALTIVFAAGTHMLRNAINSNAALETLHLIYPNEGTSYDVTDYSVSSCAALETIVIEGTILKLGTSALRGNSILATVDIENMTGQWGQHILNNAFLSSSLNKLILRQTTIANLQSVTALAGTAFASGGAGGTIYIPKALYDELGTGSSLDYKAATNWSTLDGYGTITWAQIEGSQYENYFADGTPIT